jgi:hypothetical protein
LHLEPQPDREVRQETDMPLLIRELHQPKSRESLNEEWVLLENTGPNPLNAQGCAVTIARNTTERPHPIGTLDPGFVLHPNEKIRLVTGTPSKKAQGTPPEEKDGVKNYHLFLREPVLSKPGVVVRIALKQMELAKAVFAPTAKDGIQAD